MRCLQIDPDGRRLHRDFWNGDITNKAALYEHPGSSRDRPWTENVNGLTDLSLLEVSTGGCHRCGEIAKFYVGLQRVEREIISAGCFFETFAILAVEFAA